MLRIVILLWGILLSGCASVPPMPTDAAGNIKNSKSVVSFFDVTERINYIEDVYLVLGVAQVTSNSVYSGIWNSNKDLSAVHSEELSKIGVRASSLYDVLSDKEISEITAIQKEMLTLNSPGVDKSELKLNPRYRDILLNKGFNHLFWLTWSGYTLHIKTLGLPTRGSFGTTYWIFDLNSNKLIWSGSFYTTEKVLIVGVTGKEFIEKGNLAGLKSEVTRMTKERYKKISIDGQNRKSIGQRIGLEENK